MVKYRSLKDREKDAPKKVSLPGVKYRPIEEVTKTYKPKKPTIRSFEEEMVESFGLDMEWEDKQKAREKASKLPKLDIEKIRNQSGNYDPDAEFLTKEEISRNNRRAHIDAGFQEEVKVPKKPSILSALVADNATDETRATLGIKRKVSLPGATLSGKQPARQNQTAENGRYMTDENIKSQVEPEKKQIGWRQDRAESLVKGIKDVPRNLGAGIIQALDTGAEFFTGGQHNNQYKARTEEDWKQADTPFKTYDEYLAHIDTLNKGVTKQKDTVNRIASKITPETTFVEKAIRGAALNLPSSFLTAGMGGLGAGIAQGFTKNKIIVEGVRNLPLFASGLNGGLETADQIGLTGAKKYTYGIASGIIETATERMSMLGFEGQLMGKATSGATGGFGEVVRGLIEEPLTEGLNSVAQQVLTGAYTSMEDFELDMEEIQISMASAFIMAGVNVSGTFRNGMKYRTVGVENGMVLVETEDGRIEPLSPEVVVKHQFEMTRPEYENIKSAYRKQNAAEMFEQYSNDEQQAQMETEATMPTQEPTRSQETFEPETEVSTPKEVKPLTKPLNEVETVSVNEIDKIIGKPKGEKDVDYLDYYEVVRNFPDYAFKADDDFIDVVDGMEIQARSVIDEAIKGKDTFKAELKNGQYIIVHPSNKNGEVQVSFFDDKGAIMDEQMKRSELTDRLLEAKVLPKDITDEGVATQTEPQTYTYTFRTRGLSPGAQPKGFISDNPNEGKYGSVTYDRPLTAKEISNYELNDTNVATTVNDGKSIKAKDMETRLTAEAKLENMIEKKLIDSTNNRKVAEKLNRQIVELGGEDRSKDFEKKVKAPKPKSETITVKDDSLVANNMAVMESETSDAIEPWENERKFTTSQTKETYMNSSKIDPVMKDRVIADDPALIERRSQQDVYMEASSDITRKGYDTSYNELLDRFNKGDLLSTDYDQANIQALIAENQRMRRRHKDNGFYQSQFEKLYEISMKSGTETARGLSMRGRMVDTPIGKALATKKEIDSLVKPEDRKIVDRMDDTLDKHSEDGYTIKESEIEDFLADIDNAFNVPKNWLDSLKEDLADKKITLPEVKEKLRQELGIPVLTTAEFDEVTKFMEEIEKLDPESETYEKDKEKILDKARQIIREKKITLWDKVSSIQTMAMLMNVKTTMRNEIGNFMGFGTKQIDDIFSFFFDVALSKVTGKRGTVNPEIDFRKYRYKDGVKKSFQQYNDNLMKDTDTKYTKKRVFAPGSNLGKLEGIMTVMLSDKRHKEPAIQFLMDQIDATKEWSDARGIEFDAEGAKADINFTTDYYTFNFDSGLATWLDGIVKSTNKKFLFKDEAFGLGTILAKFAKTPMNIVQFQLDHLGADIFREGVKTARMAKKVGMKNAIKENQGRISRALGKTSTGVSYIALGALLSNLGAFVDEEEDKDTKALLEANGVKGSYFNFSALRRGIFGGKHGYQEGDTTIDIRWMLPVAPFLILGSRLAKAKNEEEQNTILAGLQTTLETMGASLSDFAELPFNRTLGIITSPYYTGMDKFNLIASGTVTGFIPSPLKQLAQGIDPTSKAYSKNTAEAFGQQIKASLPGLRNTVPDRFDIKGESVRFTDNETMGWDIFEMFLNPAYRDKVGGDKDIEGILEASKEGKLVSLPKVNKDNFSYKGESYKMTPEQHKKYQATYWEAYKSVYKKNKPGTNDKYNAHDYATNKAKIEYLKSMDIKYELTTGGNLK